MKLISWNVNGIRACLTKGFSDFLKKEDADIVCIQETKARPEDVDEKFLTYPHQYWNCADKKGYSGTLILSKIKPISVINDFEGHSGEGRVITAEYDNFYLITCYTPNSKRGLLRLDYRQQWDADFLKYIKKLEMKKPIILCGDLNVAHEEIDIARPKSNHFSAGFSDEERQGFTNIVNAGFVDSFRHFYPDKKDIYSWWSYMFNSRAKNIGWRIDYFVTSPKLVNELEDSLILTDVLGSDHCPVCLVLK